MTRHSGNRIQLLARRGITGGCTTTNYCPGSPVGGNQITGGIPCSADGQDGSNIFARSVRGVMPRASITWFQARRALANSGKRLPTNADWQIAVRGTPDGFPCNFNSSGLAPTGSSSSSKKGFRGAR